MDTEPSTPSAPPPRKRRCTTTNVSKGFKKEFDAPPSTLSNCPPSSHKSMPFKLMVADWWLKNHGDTKALDGATWLVGFHSRLKEEDLHLTDSKYLKDLIVWHEGKRCVT